MKLEQLYPLINYLLNFKLFFYLKLFFNLVNFFFLNYFFIWKLSNYADSYWFFYSNKKSLYELRHISNK